MFTIPGYQRPYAWGMEQAQELLDDLLGAMSGAPAQLSEAAPYFLGSIVLIKGDASAEATVVDGQQRLTTLTLLLSANRIKVLVRDGIGIWLAARRLHQGKFVWPAPGNEQWQLEFDQFQVLVLGLPWRRMGDTGIINVA